MFSFPITCKPLCCKYIPIRAYALKTNINITYNLNIDPGLYDEICLKSKIYIVFQRNGMFKIETLFYRENKTAVFQIAVTYTSSFWCNLEKQSSRKL